MDAVMARPTMLKQGLDSGHETGHTEGSAPALLLPPATPPRAPLTAPAMPSMGPLLAPPPGQPANPPATQPGPTGLVPPDARPLLPSLGAAPALAPLPPPPTMMDVPAWARAAPASEIAPLLPTAAPTAPAAPMVLAAPLLAPEPAQLTAALDAAGAPLVPTSQTVAGRRAAELRASRRKRAQRIRIAGALVFLAAAALTGPPLVRWITDQVSGGGQPLAPEAPAVVDLDAPAG